MVNTWEIVVKFQHLVVIFLVALLTAALYLTQGSYWKIVRVQRTYTKNRPNITKCDLYSGKWIFDNRSYPMYDELQCPFVEDDFACIRQGRKDSKYQNWRWKPHHCDLPRFNATAFLEKIRGKRLVYAGDSLMRNQWESMLCLLGPAIPAPPPGSFIKPRNFKILVPEYNVTIESYWSPMLVETNRDDPLDHRGVNLTLRIEAIEAHARQWNDVDILIFDSFAWWRVKNITVMWGSFESPGATYKKEKLSMRHFEMAVKTWSDWLELNINRTKTTLFYMSMSPSHEHAEQWGRERGINCYGETEQIAEVEKYWNTSSINHRLMAIAESAIKELETRGVKVQYVNITRLSAYRKDAHPSFYGSFPVPHRFRKRWTNPAVYSDCLHWCLPGVPDVWNQLLYAHIMDS